jgi:hypothetical protein
VERAWVRGCISWLENRNHRILFCCRLQGCKLLSDIGQCPTKFGKCPSKSNFERTLVRSQKKLSHLIPFCCDKIRLQIHSICIFFNKMLPGILAFYLTLHRNGYTYLSHDLYISCDVYICPTKFSSVGFCPTKFKLCPTKIKSDRTNVLSSQIFICSHEALMFILSFSSC